MPSEVPAGWRWTRIGEHFHRVTRKNTAGIRRVLTASGENGLVDQEDFFNKRVAGKNLAGYSHLKRGEFAYNRSSMKGYRCGAIKRLDRYDDGVLSTLYLCIGLRPNAEIATDYAAQLFDSGQLEGELRPIARVGARAHGLLNVTPTDFMEVSFPLPPLPEQKKIAAILSSVDEAIQARRAVIEQTRRVKEGLLQDLLTRGIGHTRFKQTEIGEIPEEWKVAFLDEVALRGSGHTPSKSFPEYWNGATKWVSLADSQVLDRVYLSKTDKTITPEGIANSSAVLHPAGTVFVSRDASVGRSAIAACELAVSQHFIAWRCGPKLNNHFLYYFLQRHKAQFERIAVGSTIKTIGLGYFKKLRVPLPPRFEQDGIAERLLCHDQSIWQNETQLAAIQQVKAGLLQDLLTGKVRVSV